MAQRRQIGHQEKNEFFFYLSGNLKQEDGKLRIPCPFLGRGEWKLILRHCIATFNERSEPRTERRQSFGHIFVKCNLVPYANLNCTWIDRVRRGERKDLFGAAEPTFSSREVIGVHSNIEMTFTIMPESTGSAVPLKKDIDVFVSISLQRCT